MTGLEKIKQGILDEAKDAVKAAMEEAEAESKKIEEASKAETEKICSEISKANELQIASLKERTKSSIDLERSRKILETKQNLIAEVVSKAKDEIKCLSDEKYFDLIIKIANRAVHSGEGIFMMSAKDLARIPENFTEQIKQIADSRGAVLRVSKEAIDIEDGFILSYGGVEENCTFEAIFAEKKEELSDIAQKILFQ